ncbi:MAG TPA: glycoside hydrolase family 16 protein [Peptococcaceae bacterium]|nr:glycoside hydrolase family 16 protein [Peptococcaceae bacterium]HQD54377.1 glycoside hydrolase family 16 protein [Peptococcaceae bacterium]
MLGFGDHWKGFKPLIALATMIVFIGSFVTVSNDVEDAHAAEWDKPGYILTFHDEFDGNSLDLKKWNNWDMNFSGGSGVVSTSNDFAYCPENVSVSGGMLRIKAEQKTITAPLCGGGTRTVNYRTGEINTQNKFHQTYGWFEARIKFPKARALYPAFWLMPAPGVGMIDENGGRGAEVDIMEYETYWMGNQVTSSIWFGGYGSNLQGGGIGSTYSPISNANDWHVYALNWEPGKLEIYVDGKKTQTYTGKGVPSGDEFIILSMAVASWGKSCVDSELPDYMLVDYVRVYKKADGSSSQIQTPSSSTSQPTSQPATTTPSNIASDKPGYQLTFYDDFNGNALDLNKWNNWDLNFNGGPGIVSSKHDYAFCPENVKVSGGYLNITCTRQPITAPLCGGGTKTVNYRSGEINTKGKFQQTYGWFEARIKFPQARSLIPAFWLMPAPGIRMIDQDGPGTGAGAEVDIMEHHTHWMGNSVSHALWYGGYGANLKGGGIGSTYSSISNANDWHVYALNWEPGKLEIYVDGVKTQEYTGPGIPFADEYIVLSLHVGDWGQAVVDSELPSTMLVDYVKVYKKVDGAVSQLQDSTNTQPHTSNQQTAPNPQTKSETSSPSVVVYNDTDSIIKYVGKWGYNKNEKQYKGDYHSSNVKGAYYTVSFTGTRLKAYGQKDDWCGKAAIYVDGKYLKTVDCYSKTVAPNQLLYDTGTLPYGNHTVKVVVLREKNSAGHEYYINADKFEIIKGAVASENHNNSSKSNSPVTINDTDSSIKYVGSWGYNKNEKQYKGDYHSSNVKGAYYTVSFTGTRLKAYGQKDDWCGKAAIYVDNKYLKTVDCYSKKVALNQLLYDTGELPYGKHVVKVVVLREKNSAGYEYYINADKFEIYK